MIRRIHQIFFDFGDGKCLQDYPMFVQSHNAFRSQPNWQYELWDEAAVERLLRTRRPELWDTYCSLEHPIMRVDFAKYLIADTFGGIVADLDVLPLCHLDDIVGDRPYVFDRCSRKHVVANDFFYVGPGGLPGFWEYFLENLAHVRSVAVYRTWKMRRIYQATGPDCLTRYLRRTGLDQHVRALSNRTFLDAKEQRRSVSAREPQIEVVHHLSWRPHVVGAE
jgi:mannosyltransferase OCH1-like enzyme